MTYEAWLREEHDDTGFGGVRSAVDDYLDEEFSAATSVDVPSDEDDADLDEGLSDSEWEHPDPACGRARCFE